MRTTRTSRRWSARSTFVSWKISSRTILTPTASPAALCKANQGLLEFVEMFKAPIKVLHPLLTATQEGNYNGTEAIGACLSTASCSRTPTSRVAELSQQQEQRSVHRPGLHRKGALLPASVGRDQDLREARPRKLVAEAPCAPDTLKMLAQFTVLVAPARAGKLQRVLEDARLRRRKPQRHRSQGEDHAGVHGRRRRRRRHGRAVDPLRVQDLV